MLLDADEIEALGLAATAGRAPAKAIARTTPLVLGRSDQELSRAAALLDIHVGAILRRVCDGVRHQTRRLIDVQEATPRLIPVQDLLMGDGGAAVVVEIAAGIGLPPGLIVMNDASARTLALMAIAPRSAGSADSPRPLSSTERRLLARFLSSLVTSIGFGLPAEAPAKPLRVVTVHSDARELVGIDRKTTMVGLPIAFGGDLTARLEIAFPSSWLVAPKSQAARSKPRQQHRLGDHHDQIVVDVAAELGRARLSLRKLLSLAPGDLVLLSSSPRSLVPVLVQGRPRLLARAEVKDGRVAMVIASPPKEVRRPVGVDVVVDATTALFGEHHG